MTSDELGTFDISLDTSALAETETVPSSESAAGYDDYVEHSVFGSVVSISYSGTSAVVSNDVEGVAVTVDGADVAVRSTVSGVRYILSGTASDGSFKIYSDKKYELDLDGAVTINGGRTTIITTGGATYDAIEKDATACAGVKADSTFTINDGWLYLKSTDQACLINGGVIEVITTGKKYTYGNNIDTSPKGIKADGNLTISGGTSTPTSSSCTQPVIIYGGSVYAGEYLTVTDGSGNLIMVC